MNVVDSSGFMEYFANGSNASFFSLPIQDTRQLIIPVISIYEVFKKICVGEGEKFAKKAVRSMKLGRVVDLNIEIALLAAAKSIQYKLPMADSVIYATALAYSATLWTQDQHFAGLPGVQYKNKA